MFSISSKLSWFMQAMKFRGDFLCYVLILSLFNLQNMSEPSDLFEVLCKYFLGMFLFSS